MNLRSKAVLEAAIKEYIKSGEPVSSKGLAKVCDFGVKDATIRAELNNLTKEGYLTQLHTSGGRMPTDKGYQFFVDSAIDDAMDSKRILSGRSGSLATKLKNGKIQDFVREFSDVTHLLGVGTSQKEHQVYKSGLDDLFDRLDLEMKEDFQEIIRDFEMLDNRFEDLVNKAFKQLDRPQVFIGKRSPITKSENLSVIVDSYDINGEKVLIAIIGPKRMDYDRNLKLFKLFHEYDE